MSSLKDAMFALDEPRPKEHLLTSISLQAGFWPPFAEVAGSKASLRDICARYSAPGAKLRALAGSKKGSWKHIDRDELVSQLRGRLRDPGAIRQEKTGLCGPMAVMFELARRRPAEYVRAVTELFEQGTFTTTGGEKIEAEAELREEPVPGIPGYGIQEADWILAASMRDYANVFDDVDDNAGEEVESYSLPGAMGDWTKNVLGLKHAYHDCTRVGEIAAIEAGQDAVSKGGVAFLLIDSNLLGDGDKAGDDEEDVWWQARPHVAGEKLGDFGGAAPGDKWTRALDDGYFPDHWVALLGDLKVVKKKSPTISLRIWSWGAEYKLSGSADSFTEYLYGVMTGLPK